MGDTISVQSFIDTLAFYETVSGLEQGMVAPGNEYGQLKTGETKLAFAANGFVKTLTSVPFEEARPDKAALPIELGLVTDNVEAAFAKALADGGCFG